MRFCYGGLGGIEVLVLQKAQVQVLRWSALRTLGDGSDWVMTGYEY